MRTIYYKPRRYEETDELFEMANVLPLKKSLMLTSGKTIWKASNSLLPPTINSYLHKRENSNSYYVPYRRIEIAQNCLSYQGIKAWNKIPENIQTATSLNSFKHKYKEHLLNTLTGKDGSYNQNNCNNNRNNNNNNNNTTNNNNNNRNSNINHDNFNIHNQFDGIQVLRTRRNNLHGLDANWTGEGLISRWDN